MAAYRREFKEAVLLSLLLASAFVSFFAGARPAVAAMDYGVYVQDEAGILPRQTKDELYGRAVWLHEQTGTAQVGVVTVKSLKGRTLEEVAVARFRSMGLGDKERNDGVLLLYEAETRHVRIEVGYGLEGRITDGKAGAILDRYFVPNRDAGRLDVAFSQTQGALVGETAAEYGLDASGSVEGVPPLSYGNDDGFFQGMPGYVKFILGIGIVLLLVLDFKLTGGAFTFFLLNMFGRRGGGGGGGGRGGGGSSGGGGASR
ncbi:TPM domain-containing protein [Cohnella suwonensis]|uniref:TPM domain-containing protein n=1 Tax=Cohnella suwonensis TaxID=696072 RepID=A0ABW0M1A3_9BACL